MPEELRYVTVRLPEEGWETLHRLCAESGISLRSAFEASVGVGLGMAERAERGELPDAHRHVYETHFAVARRIDTETREPQPRRRVGFRLEECLLERVRRLCQRRGVSLNALLAAVVTPWGAGWGEEEHRAARAEVWEAIVVAARQLDYRRRRGL